MKLRARVLLFAPLAALLMDGSCPSPEPFPPATLTAPIITQVGVDAFSFQSTPGFRPAIHVRWQMPANGSLGVREFVIFQKTMGDSSFTLLARSIPGNVFDYHENADNVGFPGLLSYKTIFFQMFAIDSVGRTSDTSAIDSLVLAWQPIPVSPVESDTISNDSLVWYVTSVMAGYYTYSMLYGDTAGLLWSAPQPIVPVYSYQGDTVQSANQIPASLFPLSPGGYTWAIKLEVPALNAQSMAVRRLYAR